MPWSLNIRLHRASRRLAVRGASLRLAIGRAWPCPTPHLAQRDDRRTPSAGLHRRVAEAFDIRRFRENRSHQLPLDPDSSSMNNAQCFETRAVSFNKIFLDNRFDIAGRNAMQVEDVGDGNPNWIFVHAPLLLA